MPPTGGTHAIILGIESLLLSLGPPTWLSQGGAYWIMVSTWIVCAAFFAVMATQVGKALGSANDGCLLAIGNVVLAFAGGAIGFLTLMESYPYFILSSMAGAFLLPAIAIWVFTGKVKRSR